MKSDRPFLCIFLHGAPPQPMRGRYPFDIDAPFACRQAIGVGASVEANRPLCPAGHRGLGKGATRPVHHDLPNTGLVFPRNASTPFLRSPVIAINPLANASAAAELSSPSAMPIIILVAS